jgi:hypothetical protein
LSIHYWPKKFHCHIYYKTKKTPIQIENNQHYMYM